MFRDEIVIDYRVATKMSITGKSSGWDNFKISLLNTVVRLPQRVEWIAASGHGAVDSPRTDEDFLFISCLCSACARRAISRAPSLG